MIESTALFFSLAYLFGCFKYATNNSRFTFVATILLGIIASLTKITTFTVALPLMIAGYYFLSKNLNHKKYGKLFLLLFLPLLTGVIWTLYADSIRSLNPIAARYFASETAAKWYLGDLNLRISSFYWAQIFKNIQTFVFHPLMFFLFPILIIFIKMNRKLIFLLILNFFLGPVFFTNMYFVHDYYLYANSIYLLVAVGLILVGLFNSPISKLFFVAYPFVIIISLWSYNQTYLPIQQNNNKAVVEMGNFISANTQQEDILLIEDHDANPEIPYYSGRKAIMLSWGSKINDSEIQQSLDMTGREKIRALIISNKRENYTDYELDLLGFSKLPAFQNSYGEVHLKND